MRLRRATGYMTMITIVFAFSEALSAHPRALPVRQFSDSLDSRP